MRVLAAAIILLFFYYAAGVVITLLLSILLAYFLDPAVEFLEKWRVPRTVGAMIMVLILIAVDTHRGLRFELAEVQRRIAASCGGGGGQDQRYRSAGFSGNAGAGRLFSSSGTRG